MTPKKRVFHIIQSLNNGGCENMLLRTLPLVNEFEHTIITLKELGDLTPRFVAANIRVVTVHCKNLFDIPGLLRLRTLVVQEKPDLVLSYLFHADMATRFVLWKTLSIPPIPFLRTTYNHPRYYIARLLSWFTRPLVRQYLANSEAVKRFYTEHLGISEKQIQVLPNGIEIIPSSPQSSLKQSLRLTENDIVITCVANLHTNKGHTYLLEAFESLHQKYSTTKLLLIGDGEERARLEQQAHSYTSKNSIIFLGKRNDVPELLALSHIFVLPTLFEGMSNALMEAMAVGLPVITTDIEENRELVKNTETGLLVPSRNSQALTESMEKLVQDPLLHSQIASTGQSFIRQNFTLKKIASDWNQFLTAYIQS